LPHAHWRLSHSQGDGVAFYGSIDLTNQFWKEIIGDVDCAGEITCNNPHYDHYNTMDLVTNGLSDEQSKLILDRIKECSKELEEIGYQSIEFYDSDEYIDECSIDFEYFEDGSMYE